MLALKEEISMCFILRPSCYQATWSTGTKRLKCKSIYHKTCNKSKLWKKKNDNNNSRQYLSHLYDLYIERERERDWQLIKSFWLHANESVKHPRCTNFASNTCRPWPSKAFSLVIFLFFSLSFYFFFFRNINTFFFLVLFNKMLQHDRNYYYYYTYTLFEV